MEPVFGYHPTIPTTRKCLVTGGSNKKDCFFSDRKLEDPNYIGLSVHMVEMRFLGYLSFPELKKKLFNFIIKKIKRII